MFLRLFTFLFAIIIFCASCSGSTTEVSNQSFRSRLIEGDNHIGWSINYFDSWHNDLQPRYLKLAEKHTITAIKLYRHLEYDTSPRISEYYVVRERRTRSCRLLAELHFAASKHGHKIISNTPEGCIQY